MGLKIVIPSYGRPSNVLTKKFLPNALLIVPESQAEDYRENYKDVVAIPDKLDGSAAKKRNAILDMFEDDVFMIDDDVVSVKNLYKDKKISGEAFEHFIFNAWVMAKDLGAGFFGCNPFSDPRRFKETQPFSLTKQSYGGLGVIKDELRFNTDLSFCEDLDFFLEKLRKYRKVVRYNFLHIIFHDTGKGAGGVDYSKKEKRLEDCRYLENKWGSDIVRLKNEETIEIGVRVPIKGI